MLSERIPAGNFNSGMVLGQLKGFATTHYGEGDWILSFSNEQIFLNHALIREKKMDAEQMQRDLAAFVLGFAGVKEAFTASDLRRQEFTQAPSASLADGLQSQSFWGCIACLGASLAGGRKAGNYPWFGLFLRYPRTHCLLWLGD